MEPAAPSFIKYGLFQMLTMAIKEKIVLLKKSCVIPQKKPALSKTEKVKHFPKQPFHSSQSNRINQKCPS